jgi:hypothetical protein
VPGDSTAADAAATAIRNACCNDLSGRERSDQAADKTVAGANRADWLNLHRLGAEGLICSHQ